MILLVETIYHFLILLLENVSIFPKEGFLQINIYFNAATSEKVKTVRYFLKTINFFDNSFIVEMIKHFSF